jgi:iron(III) transport system permease protein
VPRKFCLEAVLRPPSSHPLLHAAGLAVLLLLLLPLAHLVLQGGAFLLEGGAERLMHVRTLSLLWRTIVLAAGLGALCVALALPLAWLTHATELPGRRVFRVLLNLPLAVPSYVSGFVVIATFGPVGWLRQLAQRLGLPELPDVYAGTGVVLALLYAYPFALLSLQAALDRMDPRLWEAARGLGKPPWQAFQSVILPQLAPAMARGGLLVALYVLGDFGAVSLLRFPSLSYVIYLRYRSLVDQHEAVLLALLLVLLATALVLLLRRVSVRAGSGMHGRDTGHRWPLIPLGRWRWPAFALCCLVTAFGVLLPLLVVGYWLLRGLWAGLPSAVPWSAALGTLAVGGAAAVLILAAAAVPALIRRFGDASLGRWVQLGAHAGYALPGIVVALALVTLAATYAHPLYQTFPLLLLAYSIRFLPLAIGSLDEALAAQSPRLYEAARGLGHSPLRAWLSVVLPGAAPALWASFLAVFIALIKELPATLLVSPTGFRTLATSVWSLTEDGRFSEAAPAVLILIALASAAALLRPDLPRRQST